MARCLCPHRLQLAIEWQLGMGLIGVPTGVREGGVGLMLGEGHSWASKAGSAQAWEGGKHGLRPGLPTMLRGSADRGFKLAFKAGAPSRLRGGAFARPRKPAAGADQSGVWRGVLGGPESWLP